MALELLSPQEVNSRRWQRNKGKRFLWLQATNLCESLHCVLLAWRENGREWGRQKFAFPLQTLGEWQLPSLFNFRKVSSSFFSWPFSEWDCQITNSQLFWRGEAPKEPWGWHTDWHWLWLLQTLTLYPRLASIIKYTRVLNPQWRGLRSKLYVIPWTTLLTIKHSMNLPWVPVTIINSFQYAW